MDDDEVLVPVGSVLRAEPDVTAGERPGLEQWLEYHRATLRWKLEGLTSAQLRQRTVPPSSMSLIGLVRHMAEVERHWYRRSFLGLDAPPLYYDNETNPDGDFDDVEGCDPREALDAWQAEVAHARAVAAAADLDALVAHSTHPQGRMTMRWIQVHMIEEYARHNGHADLLREALDGSTGD